MGASPSPSPRRRTSSGRSTVRGRVLSITEDEGFEHIDSLARKYRGQDRYPRERLEGQTRLKIVIEPLHIVERLRRRE